MIKKTLKKIFKKALPIDEYNSLKHSDDQTRSVNEPLAEVVVKGSREGFIESINNF
jgi:hypothetical protein